MSHFFMGLAMFAPFIAAFIEYVQSRKDPHYKMDPFRAAINTFSIVVFCCIIGVYAARFERDVFHPKPTITVPIEHKLNMR